MGGNDSTCEGARLAFVGPQNEACSRTCIELLWVPKGGLAEVTRKMQSDEQE